MKLIWINFATWYERKVFQAQLRRKHIREVHARNMMLAELAYPNFEALP